jgi:hypothetical protein
MSLVQSVEVVKGILFLKTIVLVRLVFWINLFLFSSLFALFHALFSLLNHD